MEFFINILPGHYCSCYSNITDYGYYRYTVISNITLSLFADSDWYSVNPVEVDTQLLWGSGNVMRHIVYYEHHSLQVWAVSSLSSSAITHMAVYHVVTVTYNAVIMMLEL